MPSQDSITPVAQTATAVRWLALSVVVVEINGYTIKPGVDLNGAYLAGTNLTLVDLNGAYLYEADLHMADLAGANLHMADLRKADLREADLHMADLSNASLEGADLRKANLANANLEGVDFTFPDVTCEDDTLTWLEGADLREANLRGANFAGADLDWALLMEARANENTIWPDEVFPVRRGVIFD